MHHSVRWYPTIEIKHKHILVTHIGHSWTYENFPSSPKIVECFHLVLLTYENRKFSELDFVWIILLAHFRWVPCTTIDLRRCETSVFNRCETWLSAQFGISPKRWESQLCHSKEERASQKQSGTKLPDHRPKPERVTVKKQYERIQKYAHRFPSSGLLIVRRFYCSNLSASLCGTKQFSSQSQSAIKSVFCVLVPFTRTRSGGGVDTCLMHRFPFILSSSPLSVDFPLSVQ